MEFDTARSIGSPFYDTYRQAIGFGLLRFLPRRGKKDCVTGDARG